MMSFQLRSRLLAVFLLFLVAVPVSAGYYKWTDENGVTHFSDEPPGPDGKPVRPNGTTVIPMRENIRTQRNLEQIKKIRPSSSKANTARNKADNAKSEWEKEQKRMEQKRQHALCEKYEDRIDWIDSRLRAGGYSAEYGNRLRAERRDRSKKLAWECLRR